MQLFQQLTHSHLLGLRPRIAGISVGVQTALVTDPDTMLVSVQAVSTDHLIRTTILYGAVTTDNLMVATTILETSLEVPGINFVKAALLPRTDSRAMHDD